MECGFVSLAETWLRSGRESATGIGDVVRLVETWMVGEVTSVSWLRRPILCLQSPTVSSGSRTNSVSVFTNGLKDFW